jgi:hypothetical protein
MQTENETRPLFNLGLLCSTIGVMEALDLAKVDMADLLERHLCGDWGDLSPEDKLANDRALEENDRILSAYFLPTGKKIWIITEYDRSMTTLLLPSEY